MSLKTHARVGGADRAWQSHKQTSFITAADNARDIADAQKKQISDRIKTTGVAPGKVYKAKLGDDLRAFKYKVTRVDRPQGVVYLKNEHATVRKLRVFDPVFGTVAKKKKMGREWVAVK